MECQTQQKQRNVRGHVVSANGISNTNSHRNKRQPVYYVDIMYQVSPVTL